MTLRRSVLIEFNTKVTAFKVLRGSLEAAAVCEKGNSEGGRDGVDQDQRSYSVGPIDVQVQERHEDGDEVERGQHWQRDQRGEPSHRF